MDLASLDSVSASNEGVEMPVRDASGKAATTAEGDPITITLLGQDSERFQNRKRQHVDKVLQNQTRRKAAAMTAAGFEEDTLEDLVACTVNWQNIVYDGQNLECTPDNVRMIYTRLPLLREQVEEFILDRTNFLRASVRT